MLQAAHLCFWHVVGCGKPQKRANASRGGRLDKGDDWCVLVVVADGGTNCFHYVSFSLTLITDNKWTSAREMLWANEDYIILCKRHTRLHRKCSLIELLSVSAPCDSLSHMDVWASIAHPFSVFVSASWIYTLNAVCRPVYGNCFFPGMR